MGIFLQRCWDAFTIFPLHAMMFPLCPQCATLQAVLIFSAADEVLLTFVLNPVLGEPRQAKAERGRWKEAVDTTGTSRMNPTKHMLRSNIVHERKLFFGGENNFLIFSIFGGRWSSNLLCTVVGRGHLHTESRRLPFFSNIGVLHWFAHCCPMYLKMEILDERGCMTMVFTENSLDFGWFEVLQYKNFRLIYMNFKHFNIVFLNYFWTWENTKKIQFRSLQGISTWLASSGTHLDPDALWDLDAADTTLNFGKSDLGWERWITTDLGWITASIISGE